MLLNTTMRMTIEKQNKNTPELEKSYQNRLILSDSEVKSPEM